MAQTSHFDASTTARLWKNIAMSVHPADGENVIAWDDEGDATSWALMINDTAPSASAPLYRANGINGLGSVEWGSGRNKLQAYPDSGSFSPQQPISDYINADEYCIWIVFQLNEDATNTTPIYDNYALLFDGLQFFGIHLTTATGVNTAWIYNWDGNADSVGVTFNQGEPVVLRVRHEGGNIYIKANDGSESSVASGNTSTITGGGFQVAHVDKDLWVGEILSHDTGDADGDMDTIHTDLLEKWVGIPKQKVTQVAVLVGRDEYLDAAPPPTITPCVGGGTYAAGANPSDGTSLATATSIFPWIESTIGGTAYAWGQAADNKGTYAIRPLVKEFGPIRRRLSDPRGGYVGSSQDITLLDDGGVIAGIYASQSWIRKTVHTYVQEVTGIGTGTKQRRFRGYIRSLKHEGGIRYRMTVEDVLSFYFSKNGQERKIPQTLITVTDNNADPGLRLKCAPVLYGSLSSANDTTPDGAVEFDFVATETLDPPNDVLGNLHKHLIGISPVGDTQAVFMGDPSSNPPTIRSQVAVGEYGTRVFAPHQTGFPLAVSYQVRDGKRWAFLFVDQNHPGADAARYGRIPITGDVCGREEVGDGTGDTLDLLPYQYMHVLDTEVFQAVGDEDWPGLLTLDSYTIINHASFVTVDGIQDTRLTGGAPGAFSLGHGGRQITLRQFIKQANISGDWDTGIDHHGRVMIDMLDRSDAYASAPVFTEGLNILDGTFRVEDDGSDRVANKVTAKYKRRYRRSLQQPTTLLAGSRGPREPFDPDFDELYENEDTTAQQDLGTASNPEIRELELELELVRDTDWAENVVDNQLDMWKSASGRPTVSFDVLYRDGVTVQIGGVIKVTHSEAPASGGWTLQRLRVVGIDDYPGERITFYALYVDDLLP